MKRKTSYAFTLLELLIVMVIILILASFAYPVFNSVQERAYITRDLNNLRQIGFATQQYLTDNDGSVFLSTSSWMSQLHPKYLPDWSIFQAPWDHRTSTGTGDAGTPVSYGFNGNGIIGQSPRFDVSKIMFPVTFIFFGSAQAPGTNVTFQGTAASPNVTVYKDTSIPGGTVNCGVSNCGTQEQRQRISAVCTDGHAENLLWKIFKNGSCDPVLDPYGCCRWSPVCAP